MNSKKLKAYLISIIVGQVLAVGFWYFLDRNFFVGFLLGSIVSIFIGYKEEVSNTPS